MNSCRILLLIFLIRQTIIVAGKSGLAIFLLDQRREKAERDVKRGCNYHSQRPNDGTIRVIGQVTVDMNWIGLTKDTWHRQEHDGGS